VRLEFDVSEICRFSDDTSSFEPLLDGVEFSVAVDLLAMTEGVAAFLAPNSSLNMSLPLGVAVREG
jgi:hypothetical protein